MSSSTIHPPPVIVAINGQRKEIMMPKITLITARVVGYQVRYRYNGNTYSTRTKHDPGESLCLRIVASPAEN